MEEEMCGTTTTATRQNCLDILNEIYAVRNEIKEKLKPVLVDDCVKSGQEQVPVSNNSTLIRDLEKLLSSMRSLSNKIDL